MLILFIMFCSCRLPLIHTKHCRSYQPALKQTPLVQKSEIRDLNLTLLGQWILPAYVLLCLFIINSARIKQTSLGPLPTLTAYPDSCQPYSYIILFFGADACIHVVCVTCKKADSYRLLSSPILDLRGANYVNTDAYKAG